jgi:DNA repair exonuclease SbcCD ATPase subunit
MLKKITIKEIEYQGFKNSLEMVRIKLSEITRIFGENGVGKTTVGEAIAWALLGCNLFGNSRADSTLMNENVSNMYVKILFNDGEKDQILLRYKNSKTHIYLAESTEENWQMPIQMLRKVATEINQKDIEIDSDIFMTIFSQEFFPNLDTDRAKRIMTSLVPTVLSEEVFSQISEYSQNLLKEYDMDFPNKLLDEKKSELKDIEGDLIYNEGAKGTLKQLIKELEDSLPEEIDEDRLKILTKEKEKIFNFEYPKSLIESEKEEKKLAIKLERLKEKRAELEKGLGKPKFIETNQYETEILKLEKEIFELNKENPSGLVDDTKAITKKNVLESELEKLQKLVIDGGDCPTCNRPLTNEQIKPLIDNLKEELDNIYGELKSIDNHNVTVSKKHQQNISKQINSKQDRIKELTAKIEDAKKKNKEIKDNFEIKQQEALADLNKQIAELDEKVQTLYLQNKQARLESEKNYFAEVNKIDTQINALETQKKEREQILKKIEESNKKYNDIINNDKMLEDKKVQLNILINSIKEFIEKKVELETQSINLYFNRASLVLSKVVKTTGEVKECFELRYDNKDYKVLSTGEKIRLFVEVSNMVLCILGVDYPVFIDQAESVTEYESFASQIIEANHIRGMEFTVNNEVA